MGEIKTHSIDAISLSVVFPVRIDGADRLENLDASSRYVRQSFTGAQLILVECDRTSKVPQTIKDIFDRVIFISSETPFSKSLCMNTGLLECTRPIVAFYDVDVLVHPAAAAWAIEAIQSGKYPVVLPFNGVFVDVGGDRRVDVIERLDVGSLASDTMRIINKLPDATARVVDGGVFLADREILTLEGGYNSRMISYGWEDIEVLLRLEKLGYYRAYAPHNLIHLNHSRGPDSIRNEHFDRNKAEYQRIRAMSRASLRVYVDEELRLTSGRDVADRRQALRRKKSRSAFSYPGINALFSKVRSRLRHRS